MSHTTDPILITFREPRECRKFVDYLTKYEPHEEAGVTITLLTGGRLIAAAQDLLEACKSALDFIEYASDDLKHRGETLAQKDKLLSAITKAEGTA